MRAHRTDGGMCTRTEARSFLSSISYDVLTDDDDGTRSDRTDGRPMKPSLECKAGRKRYQRRHRSRKKGKPRKASCEHGAAFDRHATTQACLVEAAETVSVDTVLVYDVRRAAGVLPCTLESVLFPSPSAAAADALSGFLDRPYKHTFIYGCPAPHDVKTARSCSCI